MPKVYGLYACRQRMTTDNSDSCSVFTIRHYFVCRKSQLFECHRECFMLLPFAYGSLVTADSVFAHQSSVWVDWKWRRTRKWEVRAIGIKGYLRSSKLFSVPFLNPNHVGHKPGILRDFSEHGKLGYFSGNSVQPQGKMLSKYF